MEEYYELAEEALKKEEKQLEEDKFKQFCEKGRLLELELSLRGLAGIQKGDGMSDTEMKSSDNWKHRSSNMRCRTCMYFVEKVDQDGFSLLGRCRRHAPTMSGFPVVFQNDWCGDHKLDENRI